MAEVGVRTLVVSSDPPAEAGARGRSVVSRLSDVAASKMLARRRADIGCPQRPTSRSWRKRQVARQQVIARCCEQNARAPERGHPLSAATHQPKLAQGAGRSSAGYRTLLRAGCSRAGVRTSVVRSDPPAEAGARGRSVVSRLSDVAASRMLARRSADIGCPQRPTSRSWRKGQVSRQQVIGRCCEQDARAPERGHPLSAAIHQPRLAQEAGRSSAGYRTLLRAECSRADLRLPARVRSVSHRSMPPAPISPSRTRSRKTSARLVPMHELLQPAWKAGYAVPSFCAWNAEVAETALQVATELNAPVILMSGPGEFGLNSPDTLARIAKALIQKYPVRAALHLDHGDSPAMVAECIRAGFTSVMLDYSLRPFEENVAALKEVVRNARPKGITVEGEIGNVGKVDDITVEGGENSTLTEPSDAARYAELTGVDALAVSIGNAHGIYTRLP